MQKELGSETESWGLRQDGSLVHNNIVLDKISTELEEGDVIVSWTDINSLFFIRLIKENRGESTSLIRLRYH